MKKWMAAIGLVVLLLVGVMPATVTSAAPTISGSVWVGGVELDSIGDYVESSNGGRATLYCTSLGLVLVLDNYVYEGSGYEYATGCYAGIYYVDTDRLSIILGTNTSGKASENSITITAENATESYGIYVDTSYTSNLFIGGSENDAADILTVTGGTATTQSSGIKVTNGIKIISTYEEVYTSADAESTKFYADGNFTVNAIGGTVTGNGACSVGMDLVQGASWNDSTFAKGTFNATGGEASNGISYGIRNSVVNNEDPNLYFVFSGATVTATGGTGKSGSYGITGKEVSIEGGTVTANAGNSTGGTASTSAGISCTTLNVSGGTVTATGGTAEGYSTPTSYGINCSGDATFSGGKITATGGKASYEIDSNKTEVLHEAKTYGIYADTMTISGAEVTATGGTCGGHVSGSSRNLRRSYGCYGNITMTDGSLIAIGGNLLMEDTTTGGRYSYGIYGGITATRGTIGATGGNTVGGESYGIYLNKDSSFSGDVEVTATTKTESTDDYRYAIYAKEPQSVVAMELTVADSASVTANVAEEASLGTSGIYVYSSYITFIQTGGTVVASAPTKRANHAGAYFMNANISGGTFNATAKTMAFYADKLNLTGGVITGTANSTLDDTLAVASTGVQIDTLTMTAGSITGQGGESSTSASYGVRIGTSANVSDGTITGTGGRVSSGNQGVMSYGIEAPGLTLSGGTVTGTGGQASGSSYGVYVTSRATLSEEAVLVGDGGVSDGGNSTGIFGKNFSVANSASVTGTGGQASNGNSTGISLSEAFVMSADSSAQVIGNGGSGNSSRGIYLSCNYTLAGGTLTATGGTPYTTESLGIYLYFYDFLMEGTYVTATGYTNAVGGDDKFVHSEAMAASANMDGSNRVELQYGSYLVSSLAKYKYLNAGTTEQLGFTPGERDISDAEIILGPTLTYNGEAQTMTVTSVMLGGVDLLEEGWVTVTNNTVTDAGTHTLAVTATEESYYTGSATKEFTVNRLTITPIVTVKEASYPYNSTIDPSDVIVKHGETELVYGKDYTIYAQGTSSVGEDQGYVMVLSVATGSNYNWYGTAEGTFTVVKAENPVVVEPTATVIRGGNYIDLMVNCSNKVNDPSYAIEEPALGCTVTGSGGFTSGNETGEVTVILTFAEDDYYKSTTEEITVTITDKNKATLNSVHQNGVIYGATLQNPQYSEPTGTQTRTITYGGTTLLDAAYPISSEKPTDAGNYTVYVVCETSDTIYSGQATFEISPKNIPSSNITLANDELVYTGEPQTIEVTEVYDTALEKALVAGKDYVVTGNVQTNADSYQLTITGMGNYTGTATESYEITKAIPKREDFTIPLYTSMVNYTGVAVELPLPTTEKIGMGDVYFSSIPTNAGAHTIYFNVHDGDNYTAATDLEYGPLTINQIDRPTTVTDAEVIVGGNEINLNNFVSTEGYPEKTYNIEGEALGCSIDGSYFTSGTETGPVRVRVTLDGGGSYRETVVWFNVTVKAKKTASLTVTQPDVEYNYGEDIGMLSPDFDGEAGTLVSQTMVYAGTLWNGEIYASSETEPTQAGTYTVTVTYESKDTIYTGSTTFKINRKQIGGTITLGPALTYTGAPQTQTITNVQTGDYIYTEADYDVLGNVQTDAGTYTLTLEGKGNFTGTTNKSYTIAKATPQRSDFNIPALTAVDYTGEEIPVALPTSIREGMGAVYLTGGNGIINAGDYVITFGVPEGKNYKAASGFAYGTLTVNKVDHPMEVTNAIVGIGGKNINLNTRVTLEFGYYASFEFVTPEAERRGCQINGATFTSGDEPVIVTVRATVQEGTNYLTTSREFTVTVVEEGGVKVYCSATCSCSNTDETTFQLIQDDVVKYEIAILNNNPSVEFDGVAAGTYTLRVSKANHITVEKEFTVESEDVYVETVELKTEVENATIKHNCSFGNDFTLLYAIPKSELAGFENIRLSVEKDVYSGDTLTGTETVVLSWTDYMIGSAEHYRFDYSGISARQIGDELRATLIAERDGVTYYGTVDVYCLKDFAYNRLTKSSDNTFKRLLVDMLDYCSMAQTYFSYRESDLVNEELTAEQRALSIGTYATLQNNEAIVIERPNKTITTIRKNVKHGNRIEPLFAMDLSGYPDRSRIMLHVEYTDNRGQKQILNIPGNTFGYDSSINMEYGMVSTLKASELRKVLEVTVLYDDEPISDTIAYSIETYIYKRLISSNDEVYKDFLRELMVYGDSCEAYFN